MDRNLCAISDAVSGNRWAYEYATRAGLTALLPALDKANDALLNPAIPNDEVIAAHIKITKLTSEPSILTELANVQKAFDGSWYGPAPITRSAANIDETLRAFKPRSAWWLNRIARPEPVEVAPVETIVTPAAPKVVTPTAPAPVTAPNAATRHKKGLLPPVGTTLTHTDKAGHTATANVTAAGVEFNGQVFHSLSASALVAAHSLGSAVKAVNGNVFWTVTPPKGA